MIREKKNVSLLLIGISISVHLFVFFDYKFLITTWDHPNTWQMQSYLLIIFSFITSILIIYLKKIRLFLLILKFIALSILGYPLGTYLNIETILLASLILETIYYIPEYYGAIPSIVFTIITFLNQKHIVSWGVEYGRADNNQLLFFVFTSLLILIMALFLKKLFKQVQNSSFNLNRLDNAVKELTDINLGFQNHAFVIEHDAIENERKRISREMHDIIGYTLTNQLMIIQAALTMKEGLTPEIKSLLLQSQTQTNDGMEQARSALYKLRAFSPETEIGVKRLYKLIQTFEKITGITIKIDFSNVPDVLGKKIEEVIYRLIQESLTNAFRHGKATSISIIMSLIHREIIISIWDNGRGSSKINEGIGLQGMRERIDSLNGTFETSTLHSGFTVRARIPYIIKEDEVNNEHITS
ncbi:MAG: sensor histidine kinase [Spirochaetaceae bacterium]